MTIFVNGKQKRVRRPPTIDGMSVDEFIRQNADPIWLHQNGMHELLYELYELEQASQRFSPRAPGEGTSAEDNDEIPF